MAWSLFTRFEKTGGDVVSKVVDACQGTVAPDLVLNQRSMPLWRRSSLTESFLRPFRRRALKTLRPSTDDMRLRNPCLLRRLRTEGWKVLLLITSYSTPSKGTAKIVEVILFHNRRWILFLTGFFKTKPGAGVGMDLV